MLRYLQDEKAFCDYAYQALNPQFGDRAAFDAFFRSITSDARKDAFLRVASFYLFLVKSGDWTVTVAGSNPVIDYLTNSYKLVSMFSLIESLGDGEYVDFYQWLMARSRKELFPLPRADMSRLYDEYKAEFGSIRRCIAFFERLPEEQRTKLLGAITIADDAMTLKDVALYLYSLRSKFVHEGRLVLQISQQPTIDLDGKTVRLVKLSIAGMLEVFERGLIAYFTPNAVLERA